MQPFDYRLAVQNPVQMALQGYMQGQQMVGQREEAAMNRELFDLKKQEFQMGQQKLAQEQAQAQAMQTDLAGFAERLATNAATIDDVISLSAKYPEIGEQVQASWTMKSDADKEATKKELVRFGSALKFSPDVATRLISERVTALEENGAPEALAAAQNIKGYLDMGMPEAALASIVLQANNVMKPEEFEAFSSVIMPKRPEAVGDVGKIIQDWENGFYEKLYGPEGAREAALADIKAAQEGKPLISLSLGDTVKTGALAPETALVEDPNAPGGLRIIPLEGGTAQSVKETAIATADDVIKTLNELKSAKGAKNRYGLASVGGFVPPVPGSEEANAQAIINKVKGAAFLQAFETLKGGGQITQIEGDKATAAITVLQDQNISWEFALKAADDLIAIVEAAKARKARGETVAPATGTTAPPTRRRFDAQGREIK